MSLVHAILHPDGQGPYPTVVALHGYGAHALDLLSLSQLLGPGMLWICPQAEVSLTDTRGTGGFTWFDFGGDAARQHEQMEHAVDQVSRFIHEAMERYPVDPERLALLGFSMGGMLGYRIALSQPERFAGFAALSSMLSAETAGTLSPLGEAAMRLPMLIQHGTEDQMIPVERARESLTRLRELGADAEYHEYKMGHQVGAESANDLGTWLASILGPGTA